MTLAKAQPPKQAKDILADAESIVLSIENIETKSKLLKKIAENFNMMQDHGQVLYLVQHSWLQANTRGDAIKLLPPVNELIPLKPEIGIDFCEAFKWADNILNG
jgi:hypothetical protein